jgi:hypothetical protein
MTGLAEAERLLRHPVASVCAVPGSGVTVAASVGGDPPCTRLAWIDWRAPAIAARLACPAGVPSRVRPVVGTDVSIDQAGIRQRILAMRVADGVHAVTVVTAEPDPPEPVPVAGGIALAPLGGDVPVLAVDALGCGGEPVGRLAAAGIGLLHLAGGRTTGRLGAGHGLAAGFGGGTWTEGQADAEFEAGRPLRLPRWVPEGLPRGAFHIEPDVAYPAAPPAVAVAWGQEPRRVLVRQAAAPLATPVVAAGRYEPVTVGSASGALMSRGRFAVLTWEDCEQAFGVQVVGIDDPARVALRVAGSL